MNFQSSKRMQKLIGSSSILARTTLVLCVCLGSSAAGKPFAYIANSADGNVSVIDTSTNTVLESPIVTGSRPIGVASALDGKRVYVTDRSESKVSIIDTAGNRVIGSVSVGSFPAGIAVSPDGKRVYVANYASDSISVIDPVALTAVAIGVGDQPYGVTTSPDGAYVYVTNRGDHTISVIDTAESKVTATLDAGGRFPLGIAVKPHGSRVYVANSGSGSISVIDPANPTPVSIIVGSAPFGIALTPDGAKTYVTNSGSNTVSVIDNATNTVTETIAVGEEPNGVAITPDGASVYVANFEDDTVTLIATASDKVVTTIPVGEEPISLGAFIADVPALIYACRTTGDLRSGGSTDTVRITNQGSADVPFNLQFVTAQGAVQGKPVVQSLTRNQTTSNTVGSLMQQAGIRTFNPSHLLQIRTAPMRGLTESPLQSVYTPTNGTPPVMMLYTCEPETPPK